MTPDELSEIEQRADVAKSVTGDDPLETWSGWSDDMQCMTYDVRGEHETYAACVAEESADLLVHGPNDIKALVSEIHRMQSILLRIDGLASRQTGPEPSGGESKRGWVYAHDIFAVLDELEQKS